jgi:putative phage-type endonuclease
MEKQRSAEWFEKRKGRVTGSVAGAILGLNPWMTADDVLRRMVREYHGAESEFTGNGATEYGQAHEEQAAFDYQLDTGRTVQECGFFTFEDWLGASPDGLIGFDGLVEFKCPYSKRNGGEFKPLSEQPHYYAQVQIELLCADRHWCDFYQWSPVQAASLERVERSDQWLAENLPTLKAFHCRYLAALKAPAQHLEPKRPTVDSQEARRLLEEIDELSDAIDMATERKKEAMAALVKLCKDQNAEVCGRLLTNVEHQGSVNYSKIVKEHCPGVDVEQYRGKASSYWRLS